MTANAPSRRSGTPSDKAVEEAVGRLDSPWKIIARQSVEAAYPVIRGDVIAEVVAALRAEGMAGDVNYLFSAADFIEREFGAAS